MDEKVENRNAFRLSTADMVGISSIYFSILGKADNRFDPRLSVSYDK